MSRNTRLMIFGLASLAILTAGVAWTARGFMAPPTSVAVVDLDELLGSDDRLQEVRQIENQTQELIQEDVDLHTSMNDELAEIRQRLESEGESMTRNERVSLDIRRQLLEQASIPAQQELIQLKSQSFARAPFANLHERLYQTVADVAERDGWDVVLFDNSSLPVWRASTLGDMRAAKNQRSIVYRSASVDITDEVRTLMNNNFAAGGGQVQGP